MLLSGKNTDWSLGFTTPKEAIVYLGASSIDDMLGATHYAKVITAPSANKLFGLGFDEVFRLPKLPDHVVEVSKTGTVVDPWYHPMLLQSSACIYAATLVLDLVYDEPVYIESMSPYALDTGDGAAYRWTTAYSINGQNIPGVDILYNADPYKRVVTPIGLTTTTVRVTVTSLTGRAGCLNLAGLAPNVQAVLEEVPIPDFGVVLDPITGTVINLSGLHVIDGYIGGVDVE